MTKHKGLVVIKHEPYKMIEYFTKNYHNEIGAFGIGKVNKDGSILVEKLVFTKQTVNSVHVAIKPEDWGELIKELDVKELSKIIFYWHKHPDGSCNSSQGDEDETYDLLMDEETGKRELMAFLVTSNINDRMEYECRIELRKPIKASIESDFKEEEDLTYEAKCQKILEKNINKEKVVKTEINYKNSNLNKPNINTEIVGRDEVDPIAIYTKSGMFILIADKSVSSFVEEDLKNVEYLISSVVKKEIRDGIRFNIVPKKDCGKLLKDDLMLLYNAVMAEEKNRREQINKVVLNNYYGYDGW